MKRVLDWLMPTWPAARLAVMRFGLGVYVLQDLLRTRDSVLRLPRSPPELWDPVGVTTWLPSPPGLMQVWALHDGTAVLALLFALGLFWRLTAPAFAISLLFLWSYRVSWQMIYHVHHLAMLHVLIMALAPAAATLSLDARFGRWWRPLTSRPADGDSWHYGWPVRLICIVTTLCYMMAGIAKLNIYGFSWADGHNLLEQIAYDGIYKAVLAPPSDQPGPLVALAYDHPIVMLPLAGGALVLETFAPLVLVHRRLGQVWSIACVGMHWGIHAFMNLVFPYPISGMAFLSFCPVEKLVPAKWR